MDRIPAPTIFAWFVAMRIKISRQGLLAIRAGSAVAGGVALGQQVDRESVGCRIIEDNLIGCLENWAPGAPVWADEGA